MRQCGDCTLCCKLLPMQRDKQPVVREAMDAMIGVGLATPEIARAMLPDFDKPAGARCPHQSHAKGCKVYARRPFGCRYWNCRWLVNNDTADLSRPDRSHYVVDMMPDFVTWVHNETGESDNFEVVQIWIDPKYPDAHRDPALRAYLLRLAEKGIAALIRFNATDAFTLIAPPMAGDKQWHEVHGNSTGREHTIEEKMAALSK